MRFGISLVLALILHVFVGWAWSFAAALLLGFWMTKRGWLWGGALLSLSWALAVAYNWIVAAGPVSRMLDVMGGILGNLSGFAVVLITILLGGLLGLIGGGLGSSLAQLLHKRETQAIATE